ncbi:MAG: LysM peptidoglycan-binding domain-containing protein [Lentisphaeria bacterium]|nr:LysM peptidoglycan-binding domain-containing protein [Lentisphaeria bacterium]
MKISACLSCASAIAATVLLTSCVHDVPVPDDAEALVWTPKIKSSYPSWQPPRVMPKGNAEYEAAFSRAGIHSQADALDLGGDVVPVPVNGATAQEEVVRLDIFGKAPGNCKINGEPLTDGMAEAFLKDFALVNAKSKVLICYSADIYAERAQYYQKRCTEFGFKAVELKKQSTAGKNSRTAARKAPVKVVIDRSIPGTTYTVRRGDSLSRIAKKHYKNGNLWQIIYRENQTILKSNANRLVPGMQLVIPAVKQVK